MYIQILRKTQRPRNFGKIWIDNTTIIKPYLASRWIQLNFAKLQNIQQICIGHCTASCSSIQLSCNRRAVLCVKGEGYHKGGSGFIATNNFNALYNKNRIV